MRKAKLPIAVFIVLIAVALVFAGCVQTTSVTVNFDYPDGSTASQVYQSDEGSPIISEAPDAKYIAGQHFTGWYLDQAFTQSVKFPHSLADTETLTLYANYVAGYAVTLSGGHGQAYATVPQTDPTLTEAPDPGTSPSGQTFMGWYLDSGLTQAVTYPYTVTSAGATFYASWQTVDPNSAVISLIIGSNSVTVATFALNSQINASDLDHGTDATGATFAGWYLDAAYTQPVTFPYTVTGNATFYAKWEEAGYTVTFNTMGGDPMPSRKLMVIPGSGNMPDDEFIPTREGYVFQGWYQNEADALAGRRKMSFPFTIRGDRTIYAGWTEELDPNEVQQFTSTKAPYDAFKEIFSRYSEAVGWEEGMYSIALEADVEGGLITLHADVLQDGGTGEFKPNDLMFKVEKFDDNTTFGIYITDNRMFIDIGGENGLYEITDIQSDYIAAIIAEVPGLLDELLDSVDLSGLDMLGGLEGIISIVFGIFFDNARITRTISNEVILENPDKDPADLNALYTDYKIEIKLNSFTSGIGDLLQLINLGSLLGFDLNLSALFAWLNEVIPQYKVIFETEFYSPDSNPDATVASIHPRIDVTYNDPDNEETLGQPAWNFGIASVTLGDAVSDVEGFLDFPDNVDAALEGTGTATEFSFTNLQFDIDLTLGTGKEGETLKKLDVGKLIKVFTDKVEIPEGLIVLEADFGYKLRAQVDLDLDYDMIESGNFEDNDNNLILLELYPLDQSGNMDEDNKAMGIYYKEGNLYISLSSLIPNYWKANNIVIDLGGVPELIAKVVTTVRTAIDDALFKDDGTEGGTENVSVQGLSATSANQLALADGGYQLSPTLGSFIETLCEVLAVPDGVLEVDGDRIVLNVQKIANQPQVGEDGKPVYDDEGNQVFVDNDIFDFIDRFMGIAGQDPISGLIPDGISGKLEFVFFEGGLKSIDISGSIAPDDTQGINVGLSINNFLIGVKDGELEARVEEGIGDTENYTNNLGELLDSALEGIDLNMNLALTFDAGQYNIGDFIAGLGLPQLIGIPLDWTFDNNFQMDLGLQVKVSLDKENPTNSMLAVEIIANKDIYIGDSTAAQPAGTLVGIYGFYDEEGVGHVAVDLSNIIIAGIQFPQLSAELNFAKLVFDLLDQLSFEIDGEQMKPGDINLRFNLSDLLGGEETASYSSASGLSTSVLSTADIVENPGATLAETELTEVGSIIVGLNSEALYASFSLAMIQKLLNAFEVSLGEIDLSSFNINVDKLNLSRLDGITLAVSGTLMKKQNVPTGESTDQNLELLIQLGTEDYPIAIGMTDDLKSDLTEKTSAIKNSLTEYREDLVALILQTVETSRIALEMDLHTIDSQMNLTQIINNILASQGQRLNLPIDLYIDTWNPVVTLVVEWDLDITEDGYIGSNAVINISLVYEGKELIGVALDKGDAILKLDGLGLFNINLTDSPLIKTLMTMIENMITKAQGTELGELIDGLLNTIDGSEQAIDVAALSEDISGTEGGDTSGDTSGETGGDEGETTPEKPTNPLTPWLQALLRSISANNTTLFVKLATDTVDKIIRGLAGFSLGIDIGLGVELDVVDGKLLLDLAINDNITLGAKLALAIGQDAVDKMMLTQEEINDNKHYTINVGTDASIIDGTSGASIAKGLLDNLNLNLSLDIRNRTFETDGGFRYLRVSIEKVRTQKMLANTGGKTAPAGTFLITVGQVNEAQYKDTQGGMDGLIYAVFDYNASTISIYAKTGWIRVLSGLVDVGSILNDQNLNIKIGDNDGDGTIEANAGEGVIGMIGTLLDGLISDLENSVNGTTTEQPSSGSDSGSDSGSGSGSGSEPQEPAPAEEGGIDLSGLTSVFDSLDIMDLLAGGIDIKFNATGTFNADVSFDAYTVNKLIDDLMNKIFGVHSVLDLSKLAPDMFTEHHLSKVAWDRDGAGGEGVEKDGFWADLAACIKDDIIPDVVASKPVVDAVGINLAPLLGMVGSTIDNILKNILRPIVTTILPMPVFNELNAGLNFVDGTLANIYITGYDRGESERNIYGPNGEVYDSWNRDPNNSMEIWIYNQFASVGALGNVVAGSQAGIVDWGEIPETVVFEPYQYNTDNFSIFVSENFEGKTARYQNGTRVVRSDVTFTFDKFEFGGQTYSGDVNTVLGDNPNLLFEMARARAAGTYNGDKLAITVTADFGGTLKREIKINLEILSLADQVENPGVGGIVSVDDLTLHAYSAMPDFVTVHLADGTTRSIGTAAIANWSVTPAPTAVNAFEGCEVENGTVTFTGGVTAPIKVTYLDSTVVKLVGSEGMTMVVDLYTLTKENTSITAFTPEVLFFNYEDGSAAAVNVIGGQGGWKASEGLAAALAERANNPTDMSAITGTVTGTIGEGVFEQTVTINVNIRTKVTQLLQYDYFDAIQINPYDIYLAVLNEEKNVSASVLPSTAVAYYEEDGDSYSETVNITTQITEAGFTFDDIRYDTTKPTTATVTLDKEKYGKYYYWQETGVKVNVVQNMITKVWFSDPDSATGYSSKLYIDPYVFFSYAEDDWEGRYNAVFPSTALIEFANGETRELPIRFPEYDSAEEMKEFAAILDYDSFNDPVQMEIGFVTDSMNMTGAAAETFEGRFLQTANVFIEVEGNEIVRYNLAGTADNEEATYKIDPVAVLLQGADPMPSSVEVIYSNGTFGTVNVFSWDLPQISSALLTDQEANRTMTVTGQLTSDGMNPISVNVEFLTRYDMQIDPITFNPLSYRVVRDDQGYGYADHGDLLFDTVTVGFKDGTKVDVYKTENGNIVYENGQPVVDHQEDNIVYYPINGVEWYTGRASFGMGESDDENVAEAILTDMYNSNATPITVEVKLIRQEVELATEDGSNMLRYDGNAYILVMLKYDSVKGEFTDAFSNFTTKPVVAPGGGGNYNLNGQMLSVGAYIDGAKEVTYMDVLADITFDEYTHTALDSINVAFKAGTLGAFDVKNGVYGSLDEALASEDQGGVKTYTAKVTIYDGDSTKVLVDVDMPIYYVYDSSVADSAEAQ